MNFNVNIKCMFSGRFGKRTNGKKKTTETQTVKTEHILEVIKGLLANEVHLY